jgi:hypothetical protein
MIQTVAIRRLDRPANWRAANDHIDLLKPDRRSEGRTPASENWIQYTCDSRPASPQSGSCSRAGLLAAMETVGDALDVAVAESFRRGTETAHRAAVA